MKVRRCGVAGKSEGKPRRCRPTAAVDDMVPQELADGIGSSAWCPAVMFAAEAVRVGDI